MSRDIAPFGLRMPPDLKKRVEDAARASGRSLNAEICQRLEQSLGIESDSSEQADLQDLRRRLETVEKLIADLRQQQD